MSEEKELWTAAFNGNLSEVQKLLKSKKIDVNLAGTQETTPFFVACQNGHVEVVRLFLTLEKVDVNKPMTGSVSPFFMACQQSHLEVVRLLLTQNKVDSNKSMTDGRTPFYIACQQGNLQIVQLLLKYDKIDVNKAKGGGVSPFYISCNQGHLGIVQVLLKDSRINVNSLSDFGNTPIVIAKNYGHSQVVQEIKKYNKEKQKSIEVEIKTAIENLKTKKELRKSSGLLLDSLDDQFTRKQAIQAGSIEVILGAIEVVEKEDKRALTRIIPAISFHDEIMKYLIKINGYQKLTNYFIKSEMGIQEWLINGLRELLSVGNTIRSSIVESSPQFIDSLFKYIQKTSNNEKQTGAGIILQLAGLTKTNQEAIKYAANEILFPMIKTGDDLFKRAALDCLMHASSIDSSRQILLELGAKQVVQPLVDNPNSEMGFVGCLIQALLSASDTGGNNNNKINPTSTIILKKIIDALNSFATTIAMHIATTVGYVAKCPTVIIAIRSLATNEENLHELQKQGVVSLFLLLLKNRKENLLEASPETAIEIVKAIWTLSFDETCKKEFLNGGVVDLLKSINIEDNQAAKQVIDSTIFTLTGIKPQKQQQSQNQPQQSQPQQSQQPQQQQSSEDSQKGHVMISYCWAQKERARGVANYLKSIGLTIWLDIDQMEGSVLEAMADAVENSSVILIFLSSHYKESQACRTEAEYCFKLKKEVIYVMAEDGYNPRGWLGALLGNKLWYNPWSNGNSNLESGCSEILKQIKRIGAVSGSLSSSNLVEPPKEQKQTEAPKIEPPSPTTNSNQPWNIRCLQLVSNLEKHGKLTKEKAGIYKKKTLAKDESLQALFEAFSLDEDLFLENLEYLD